MQDVLVVKRHNDVESRYNVLIEENEMRKKRYYFFYRKA